MEALKVGDKLWGIDMSARTREQKWAERLIVGETRVSWLVAPFWFSGSGDFGTFRPEDIDRCIKVKKKDLEAGTLRDWKITRAEVDDVLFLKNGWRLGELVDRCSDATKLRQIAAIMGFVAPDQDTE